MIIKTVGAALLATAALVGYGTLVAKNAPLLVVSKAAPAPQPYRLDGFRGWDAGYPVSYKGCKPVFIYKAGACAPKLRII